MPSTPFHVQSKAVDKASAPLAAAEASLEPLIPNTAPADERLFPIIGPRDDRGREISGCPRSVPWSLLEPHRAQAMSNHSQTLERLAERGGLSPDELHAVLHDQRWRRMDPTLAVQWLTGLVEGDRLRKTSHNTAEPAPTEPRGPAIWPLVIADARVRFTYADPLIEDMAERDRFGAEKYGVRLHANCGRNPLVDAYQECLDLTVYLRRAIEEGVGGPTMRSEYDLTLRLSKRLRYLLMSPQERERDGLIADAINMAPHGADPDATRLEAIAVVDRYLARRSEP